MAPRFLATALLLVNIAFAQDEGRQDLYYGKFQSARDFYQKAQPGGESTWWLGQAELGMKDTNAAATLYAHALAAGPNDPWALVSAGMASLLTGKDTDARNQFESAISLTKGRDAGILQAIARANIDAPAGDANYAITQLNLALKRKKTAGLFTDLGDAYAKLIDGGNAVTNYNNALQTDPSYAAAHYKTGLIYETQRNPSQFVPEYEAAIAADARYAPAFYRLYVHYYYLDVDKARDYLAKYTTLADPGPLVDQANVDILFAGGHYQEAVNRATALLPATPAAFKPHYYKLLAYAEDSLGRYADARSGMDTYLGHPDDQLTPKNYLEAARIYYKGGFGADSVFAFVERAIALDTVPAQRTAYIHYAAALADSLHDPIRKAYWAGQVYLNEKEPDPADLYAWGSEIYNTAEAIRKADSATRTGASDRFYRQADSVFACYIDKFPAYAVYGYYWRARSNWSLDTDLKKGLAAPYFEKMIAMADTSKDSAKYVDAVKTGAFYLTAYYYGKKAFREALEYDNKYLLYAPDDAGFRRLKGFIEKRLAQGGN